MIDAAAQILQSANAGKNNTDKSIGSQRNAQNSNSSFSTHYDRSKSENEKKPDEIISKRNQSKSSEVATPARKQDVSKKVNAGHDDDGSVKKTNAQTGTQPQARVQSKAKDQESTTEENAVVANNVKTEAAIAQDAEQQAAESDLSNIVTSIVSDSLPVDDSVQDDVKQTAITALLLANADDQTNGLKIGHELKLVAGDAELPQHKLGELAQSIVNEFKASVDKSEKLGKVDEPIALSRSQVLAEIEKVLNIDKLNEQNIPAQLLKSEPAVNVNATKVLSEQLSVKNLGGTTELEAEPEVILEAGSDETLEAPESVDALLAKIMERLDFGKAKSEADQFAKVVADKSTIADFVDQLTAKVGNESGDRPMFAQALSQAGKPGIGVAAPVQQFTMNTGLDKPEWGSEFSKRINFMVGNDIKHAELRLDPPELGRINIKISMNQDQATISFSSAHGNVRDAIENTLPRLRELLHDSGIQLGDANVSDRKEQNANQADGDSRLSGPVFPEVDDDDSGNDPSRQMIQHSVDGVIDYFA